MKKLNLGYFAAFSLLVSGINTLSLMASVKPSERVVVAAEKTVKNSTDVDSVIVSETDMKTGYLLKLIKPMDNSDIQSFIADKIKYPRDAKENNVEGNVSVQLTVEGNGTVSAVKVIESTDDVLTSEVINAAKDFRFEPIVQNGFPARYNLILPVKFELLK